MRSFVLYCCTSQMMTLSVKKSHADALCRPSAWLSLHSKSQLLQLKHQTPLPLTFCGIAVQYVVQEIRYKLKVYNKSTTPWDVAEFVAWLWVQQVDEKSKSWSLEWTWMFGWCLHVLGTVVRRRSCGSRLPMVSEASHRAPASLALAVHVSLNSDRLSVMSWPVPTTAPLWPSVHV